MTLIDETTAWEILRRYVQDCLQIDAQSLLAVYAIGSLPAGYYRPGQSDIDAVLIVENGSRHIWGDSEQPGKVLCELNQRYLETYQIPKDFGPFPLQESDLFPPYDPQKNLLTLEIARLKCQGRRVYGHVDLDSVPIPTADDFLRDEGRFEQWLQDEFFKHNPLNSLSAAACVNTILIHLKRFLRIKRGIIEFDKRTVIRCYLENDPPFVDDAMLRIAQAFLSSPDSSQVERLRQYVGALRRQMNAYLGI